MSNGGPTVKPITSSQSPIEVNSRHKRFPFHFVLHAHRYVSRSAWRSGPVRALKRKAEGARRSLRVWVGVLARAYDYVDNVHGKERVQLYVHIYSKSRTTTTNGHPPHMVHPLFRIFLRPVAFSYLPGGR